MNRHVAYLVTGLMVAVPLSAQSTNESLPIITSRGEATELVTPDRATVYFDLEGYGFELVDATDSVEARVSAVADALQTLDPDLHFLRWGFRAGDNPQRPQSYNPQATLIRTSQDRVALTGLQVSVADVNRLPEVVAVLASAGVRQISAVVLEHTQSEELQNTLFSEAVRRARARAESIAAGLDGSLGPILYAGPDRSGFDQGFNQIVQAVGYGGRQPSLMPSDLRVRAAVETRWRFVPN